MWHVVLKNNNNKTIYRINNSSSGRTLNYIFIHYKLYIFYIHLMARIYFIYLYMIFFFFMKEQIFKSSIIYLYVNLYN